MFFTELLHVRCMGFTKVFRDEKIEWSIHHLFGIVTKHIRGSVIEYYNVEVRICDNDSILRQFDDLGEYALLAAIEFG